jgi:hypothetical protein
MEVRQHTANRSIKINEMKKSKLFTIALLGILMAHAGCNNAGTEKDTQTKDTLSSSDTIKSDPSKFSDPH